MGIMSKFENALCLVILLGCGYVTIVIMAALFLHSEKIAEEQPCRYETSQLETDCE